MSRIVKAREFYVTFLTTQALYDRVQLELARNFDVSQAHLRERLRYASLKHIRR